jgi:hypothetical protein
METIGIVILSYKIKYLLQLNNLYVTCVNLYICLIMALRDFRLLPRC